MGEAEISSEFEYSASFLRILVPGIIVVTLASFLLILNYPQTISFFKDTVTKSVWEILPIGVIFILASIIFGLIINVLIIPLTMVLEGYYLEQYQKFCFVHILRDMFHSCQWKKFVEYRNYFESAKIDTIQRALAYNNIYYYFSHCLNELTKNPQIEDTELKKSILPTRLGNVFRSIEIYPEWKYAMDGVFFWTRIQLLMSEENRKTIDKMRAFVDMFVELTWIFFFAAIIYLFVLVRNENYVASIALYVLFVLFSLGSYKMAVQSSLKFGLYVRSIFDLHREELWNKIRNKQFKKLDSLSEKERWDNVFRYLWFYNVIQCKKCGRFYESTTEHICNS